eukprot:gene31303-6451_t
MDARHRTIATKIVEAYGLPENAVEKQILADKVKVNAFFDGSGPPSLVYLYEIPLEKGKDGNYAPSGTKPTLHRLGPNERVHGKVVYFVRLNAKGISERNIEGDMGSGEVSGSALENFRAMVSDLYLPIVQEQGTWGKVQPEHSAEFVSWTSKFGSMLTEAVNTVNGGVELVKPEPKYVDQYELKPTTINAALGDESCMTNLEDCITEWCKETETLLAETNRIKDGEEPGPDTELEYWRTRMSNFNSITEQLKTKECKLVLTVCGAGKTKGHARWKALDLSVTDAANEAKDNVKYLATLEKSMEPLFNGSIEDITNALPALINNIKMMYTIARYYSTSEYMTRLLTKLTNQLIFKCKDQITYLGKLWDQEKPSLLVNLKAAVELMRVYKEHYKLAKEQLASQPKSKQFDFDEHAIFFKADLFTKRLNKLIDMFTTIHQFSILEVHTHIVGLETMIRSLNNIIDDVKRRPYDLLDFFRNQFDRDFLEFNVNIHDLEIQLQGFVNTSFENITSTDHALSLLAQFQAILLRQTLRDDLESKYMVIFQNYARDLEMVQKLYEKNKYEPPVPRNSPPVAGCIMWARQLLRRIEQPMQKFAQNKPLMAAKESKKIVKTYNKVAKALIEFETLWHQAWIRSIEQCKAGLAAPLLIQHPETGKVLVNFDKEIMQLIRETKYMQRLGIAVPESAQMVLLQEEKFKFYYNQMTYLVKEYDGIVGQLQPTIKPLLRPHLEDMENKVTPGFSLLTWTSMNIDGYLHRFKQGLARLEELVRKVVDLVDNRMEMNLRQIGSTVLVELPADRSFSYEEFCSAQAKFQKKQGEHLAIRNEEVRRSVEDLIQLVKTYPRENTSVILDDTELNLFKRHYAKIMYRSILTCTQLSLRAMKRRLGSKVAGGFVFMERPFFNVDVELKVPNVAMNPSLTDIQSAINICAKKILTTSKMLPCWGMPEHTTFHELIIQDKEIVKSILKLTGSVDGIASQVDEYMVTFNKYDFLWKANLQQAYEQFMRTNPTLEAFESELKKYMHIETDIGTIPSVNNIGALCLETMPLKSSLKSEAASWKAQFAHNLHKQCSEDLKAFDGYIRDTTLKLNRKIEDLEDVRGIMNVLKEVREKESEIDNLIGPIEEMYTLLLRYEVKVPKEETTMVSDLRYGWKKLRKLATDVSDNLTRLQVGFKRELIKEVKAFVLDAQFFRKDWEANGPMVPGLDPMEAVERLRKFQQMFDVRKRKWENYSSGEELFGLPVTQYPELEQTEKEVQMLDRLYGLYVTVISTIKGYGDLFWVDVVEKIDEMGETVNGYQAQCKRLPKALREWPAYIDCRKTIDDFLEMLPLFQALAAKSMRERHWKEIMDVTGHDLNLAEDVFKLQHLLDCHILTHQEEVEDLTGAAVKEEQIETKLASVQSDWAVINLVFAEYKTRGPVILKGADTAELIEKLEDSQMTLGSMATNRYSAPFRDEVQGWIVQLSTVSEIVEQWLMVQNMWMYMEAVFSGGDIVKQLPQEAKRFQNIDKNYMKIVTNALETLNVVKTCYGNELMKTMLPHLLEQLELCQKSLSAYLETKRAEFPRFYFVSDPTLLEILSLGSDPPSVVPHFQSGLFDSLSNVTFDRVDKQRMTEMFSQQNECVEFEKAVEAKGNIEVWLQRLVDAMQETVKQTIKRAVRNVHEMGLEDFIFQNPAQISLLGIQFQWTADTQAALSNAKTDKTIMIKNMKKVDSILRDMVQITLRLDLTKNQRTNLETCVTVHMHQKESTEDLLKKKIKDPTDFEWLKQALEKVALEKGLQLHTSWLNKCIQLYETCLVRHGIMLVGPTGGGKSAIEECLTGALTELGTKHVIWRMNPKAITAPQMFGRMDPSTGDWTDGIFAVLWRRASKSKNGNTWIVLDGPVDAIWIENLNTVLDDNKVLTLANGDRILMSAAMKAVFEPDNLANASPATVSRAGIIYVSDTELGWEPVVKSWSARRDAAEGELLQPLFEKYTNHMLDFIRINLKPVMYNELVCSVNTLMTLLNGYIKSFKDVGKPLNADSMERVFLFCMTWSLGGLLEMKERPMFDQELRSFAMNMPPREEETDTIYEYLVNEEDLEWTHWKSQIPVWTYPKSEEKPKFAQLIIPTLDSVRFEKLLTLSYNVDRSSLLVGGPGTAKTAVIMQFISKFNPETTGNKTITFSSLTTPQIFQVTVEGAVEKRQGRTFGPPGGKQMVVFVDDISMPTINDWGDQVTNEIVRQLLEQGGMYSLDKPIGDMKFIVDVRYVAAMNTPGGGKNDIPNRLKRQYAIFNVPLPSIAAINGIFGRLVEGRFSSDVVSEDVVNVANKLVPLTIQLWNKVQSKMLPTPAKFHYLFNMRELSKVFQGVVLATRDRLNKTASAEFGGDVTGADGYLLGLWIHECHRVFCDKLVSYDDKNWVDKVLRDMCREHFNGDLIKQVEEPIYFVDFLREPVVDEDTGEMVDAHPSNYESVAGGLKEIRKVVEALQRRFNEESKVMKLDLVLFTDALCHLMRISRLLAMARGSALLVGVGGSGKQSLSRLSAYIAGSYTFQITVTKSYNMTNLFEDIKALYKIAGFKGQSVCFIFTDAEVKDEGFLEYINQILMTGEVAGLLPKDELDMIVNDMRPVMKAQAPSVVDSWENLVSGKFIDEFDMACTKEAKDALKIVMAHVHVFVTAACHEYFEKFRRHVYVTPKSYLAFIQGYKDLYQKKWSTTQELAVSIEAGLQKMLEAKADVNKMKGELAVKNQELAVAAKEAEVLLKQISESTTIAEKEKQKVLVIVESVTAKATEINAVKEDAERDLAAAKPALDAALSALNSISPKDITSLKALKNPPDVIKRIFDAVILLRYFPVDKVSWVDTKGVMVVLGTYDVAAKMMGDMGFLTALMNFPKEQINDETVELLAPYFAAPDFNFEAARKASGSVAGLCNWAEAMCTYHTVAKVVEPKIVTLREAEAELKVATKEKNQAEDRMAKVQAKLDEMQAQFDAAMAQKQALEDDAAATQKKMDGANALINALAGEEVRWTAQSKEFDSAIQRLTGDCALASGFVSYLGPFNKEFRELLLNRDIYGDCMKLNIPVTPDMQVSKFLVDDSEVGEWTLQGLPTDELSVQNGIMVTRASRYPVLVDPQGQGRIWIMNREEANQLKVTQLNDRMFRNHLEDCLSFGKPLLIENMEEELDPILDPVLERRLIKKGKTLVVPLADKEVDFTDTFRLFCTTRLPNPHFTPELCAKVTVVDFTVTLIGLEDQLLGKLILKEKHELEEQRQQLMEEVQSYKKKIKQLEDDLLFRLSNSQGNLLDDTELIDVLAVTKQTAQDVSEKLTNASETNKKINEACEEYRPVAHRATLVYFLIAEFAVVNCMYQTSLNQFNQLYEQSIDRSDKASMPSKRISNIIEHLTYEIYLYVQRGLFERHKIIFALMLTNKILLSAGKIRFGDLDVFLKGGGALDINAVRKKPKDWIPDQVWLSIVALSSMEAFRDVPDSVFRNDGLWRQWYDQEAPEQAKVPDYEDRLTKFERMCVVKTFREDRTLIAAADYISEALGQRFVESVPLNMENTHEESHNKCPLICLLSPGADPTKLIEDLAKRKKIKTLGVSMGQGQEIIARKYMATASLEGQWVLLQNTHLGLGYLTEVESYLVKEENIHEDFRLWITAEPHPQFPIGLLQMGIKITNEAPVGMKAGMRASYQWVTQDMLDAVSRQEWRQLLFVMCFMHSVTQERRKFGPIGWNVPYEFNQSDLSACVQFLQNHLMEMDAKKAPQPTWETVRYMVSCIQYGGRITDDFDQLLMDTFAEKYFHSGVMVLNFEMYKDDRSGFSYRVPDSTDIDAFRAAIEQLPSTESPEVYGLHPNADVTFRTLQVQDSIITILDTMPKGGSAASGMSREEIVDKICEDLLSKVPPMFDREETKEKLKKLPGGPTQPMNVHLRQEIDRLNMITKLTTSTLKNLRLAIAGTVALAGPLIDALDALFNARIPKSWLAKSWEANTLGSWFTGLLQRYDQLNKWISLGRPKGYWMTGFFNPQGFLTAMKQEVNRKHASDKWALDDVVMTSEVTHPPKDFEGLKEAPGEGVYIYGLYLDGCAWSGRENKMVDAEPKKLFNPLPVLYVTGVQAKDKKRSNIFEAPTYRVKARKGFNFIEKFPLRTEDPPNRW